MSLSDLYMREDENIYTRRHRDAVQPLTMPLITLINSLSIQFIRCNAFPEPFYSLAMVSLELRPRADNL